MNKKQRSPLRRKKFRRSRSTQLARLRKIIDNHFVSALSLVLSVLAILTAVLIYYLSYAEPDIRHIKPDRPDIKYTTSKHADGSTLVYVTLKERFKNQSFKTGYVDRVEFAPRKIAVLPKIDVTYISKLPIGWREDQTIEIQFLVTFNKADNEMMNAQDECMSMTLTAYDNRGQILKETDEQIFRDDIDLKCSS